MEKHSFEYLAQLTDFEVVYIKAVLAALVSFSITYFAIPKIITVSYQKHLMDEPGERSSHSKKIPNLGGTAIYYSIVIASTIFGATLFTDFTFFYGALVILFFTGLMDDILSISPKKKLYAQLLAAGMIILGSNIRINNLFGILGIYELPFLISIIITFIVFVALINAYNLIDGIDGLAAGVGIIACSGFAFTFHKAEEYSLFILSISVIFSLISFLRYNLSKKQKIFMGDTGSMIIGFILCFLSINLINYSGLPISERKFNIPTAPVICIALLIIPIIDTISVIVIRLAKNKPLFYPDKNHLHHRVMNLGTNHIQASAIILFFNLLIVFLAYFMHYSEINLMLSVIVIVSLFLSLIPFFIYRFKQKK